MAAGARAMVVHANTPLAAIAARRRADARIRGRKDITDADLAYVLAQWEAPRPDEGVVEFRPESDLASWLARLGPRAADLDGRCCRGAASNAATPRPTI